MTLPPPVLSAAEAMLGMWLKLEYAPSSGIVDAVALALRSDPGFGANNPVQGAYGVPPLAAVLQQHGWKRTQAGQKQVEHLSEALLAIGADPFCGPTPEDRCGPSSPLRHAGEVSEQLCLTLFRHANAPSADELDRSKQAWLEFACKQGYDELLAHLLDRGLSTAPHESLGSRPSLLFHAKTPTAIRLLCKAGVDPLLQDYSGKTALAEWRNTLPVAQWHALEAALNAQEVDPKNQQEQEQRNMAFDGQASGATGRHEAPDLWADALLGVLVRRDNNRNNTSTSFTITALCHLARTEARDPVRDLAFQIALGALRAIQQKKPSSTPSKKRRLFQSGSSPLPVSRQTAQLNILEQYLTQRGCPVKPVEPITPTLAAELFQRVAQRAVVRDEQTVGALWILAEDFLKTCGWLPLREWAESAGRTLEARNGYPTGRALRLVSTSTWERAAELFQGLRSTGYMNQLSAEAICPTTPEGWAVLGQVYARMRSSSSRENALMQAALAQGVDACHAVSPDHPRVQETLKRLMEQPKEGWSIVEERLLNRTLAIPAAERRRMRM